MSCQTILNNQIYFLGSWQIFKNMLNVLLIKVCFATYVCDVLNEETHELFFAKFMLWSQFQKSFSYCKKSAMFLSIFKAELAKCLSQSLHVRVVVNVVPSFHTLFLDL